MVFSVARFSTFLCPCLWPFLSIRPEPWMWARHQSTVVPCADICAASRTTWKYTHHVARDCNNRHSRVVPPSTRTPWCSKYAFRLKESIPPTPEGQTTHTGALAAFATSALLHPRSNRLRWILHHRWGRIFVSHKVDRSCLEFFSANTWTIPLSVKKERKSFLKTNGAFVEPTNYTHSLAPRFKIGCFALCSGFDVTVVYCVVWMVRERTRQACTQDHLAWTPFQVMYPVYPNKSLSFPREFWSLPQRAEHRRSSFRFY